ncbi:MAG TPA: sialidase family protein [Chthoniobacterales bacterium]|nr:sialidase family protein [Chthoniobacterales bacterium]
MSFLIALANRNAKLFAPVNAQDSLAQREPTLNSQTVTCRKIAVLSAAAFLLVASVASGQRVPRKPFPSEQLERYSDPPAYVRSHETTAAMVSRQGAFTSYQVNVDANGNNISDDAANEPSIALDPNDRNRMVIGWRQFDHVTSNFRQAGWGYTNNGGSVWAFPGSINPGVFRSDPVLAADFTGRFLYLSLKQDFFDDLWGSINGGQAWNFLGVATGGDKQWFVVDNTNSTGRGFQYQCWSTAGNNYQGRQFSRSTNGGSVWMNPINIPNSPIWGTLDVDSNGVLFIGGVNPNTGQIYSVRSSNAKNAAVTPTFDLVTPVDLGGDIVAGQSINPVGIVGQLFLAADRSGTSTNNNVYLLASVQPPNATIGTDVMFSRSTNGGQSFSAPKRVNDDPPGQKWHWFATFAVAPNGRLDAVWYDTRNAANNTDSQLFYSYSLDAGETWSPNVAVSQPFNPFLGYPDQAKIGDYITMVSDNNGGNVAYTATFNGEQDVYYVRVGPQLQLLNISTRARVLTGEQNLIAGFIVTGTAPKKVIIRGIGPSLGGLTGQLADPTLELHQGNNTLAVNDNWKVASDGSSQQAEVEATTIPPANDAEAAIVMTLAPGSYTAILAGKDGGTGIGVVEVYDLDANGNSRLANISTRGFVDTNDNILIGGLIVGGSAGGGNAPVLVRALGPSLSGFGVQGALQNPLLELHDANGTTTASNDNWQTNDQTHRSQQTEIEQTGLAPPNPAEPAVLTILPAGPATAIVRGVNNGTGVGTVEVYNLQ